MKIYTQRGKELPLRKGQTIKKDKSTETVARYSAVEQRYVLTIDDTSSEVEVNISNFSYGVPIPAEILRTVADMAAGPEFPTFETFCRRLEHAGRFA